MSKILSLPSHPPQPPQQKQDVNTLAHGDPVSYLQPSYPVPFSHCHSSSYPSCMPTPQHVFNGCNFYFGSSTSTSTQLHATNATIHRKRHRAFIESDDSD